MVVRRRLRNSGLGLVLFLFQNERVVEMRYSTRKQWLRGLLDALSVCAVIALVLANTGFVPFEGTQKESFAVFGGCPTVPCPGSCQKNWGGVATTCTVGGSPFYGTACTSWCGLCGIDPQCPGTLKKIAGGTAACDCTTGCT